MTEWEKMQQGLVYNDFDRDLFDRRVEAKKLFREYNRTSDDEVDKRLSLMRRLFKSVGENVWIEPIIRDGLTRSFISSTTPAAAP